MENLEKQVNDFNKNWFDSKRKNIGMNAFYNFLIEEDNLNRKFSNNRNEEILPRVNAPKGNFNETAEFYKDKNGLLIHNPFYNRDILHKAKGKLQSWIDNDLTNTKVIVDPELPNREGVEGYYSGLDENKIHVSDPKDLWVALHESLHRLTDFSKEDAWTGKSRHFADIQAGDNLYWDSISERYARMHADRQKWGLDPNKIYTKNDLMNLWEEKGIQPPTAFLWGDVEEQNRIINSINNSYKSGGIIKAQEGTGNLYTPHPLSPVGIALNQAKAMTKMKGEQQNLPPGVKEVVGPDGQKIAIRTEQPLVPLGQEVAAWLPGVGDIVEVGQIANDVKNGNLGSAALATVMVALPGNVGKVFRKSDVPTSKLTEAERFGIPKGERNQPAKAPTKNQTYKKTINLESDKDYLEDIEAIQQGFLGKTFLDSEHEALLDWFNSPQYKERLVKQGFSEEQINNLLSNIKDKLSRKNLKYAVDLNSIREWGIGSGMTLEIDPQLYPTYEAMTNGNIKIGGQPINWSLIQLKKGVDLDEMVPHEVGGHHLESLVAEFNAPYTSQQITDMGKKATTSSGLPEGYYPSWWETRARALTIAKQMREAGWNPNSPEQVNVWLNKHLLKEGTNAGQGALYYSRPEFIKAVTTGLKQGGKLPF